MAADRRTGWKVTVPDAYHLPTAHRPALPPHRCRRQRVARRHAHAARPGLSLRQRQSFGCRRPALL